MGIIEKIFGNSSKTENIVAKKDQEDKNGQPDALIENSQSEFEEERSAEGSRKMSEGEKQRIAWKKKLKKRDEQWRAQLLQERMQLEEETKRKQQQKAQLKKAEENQNKSHQQEIEENELVSKQYENERKKERNYYIAFIKTYCKHAIKQINNASEKFYKKYGEKLPIPNISFENVQLPECSENMRWNLGEIASLCQNKSDTIAMSYEYYNSTNISLFYNEIASKLGGEIPAEILQQLSMLASYENLINDAFETEFAKERALQKQ